MSQELSDDTREFHAKATRPNELWQTDFPIFKIIGWCWIHPPTVLDDVARCIIAWRLCSNMRAENVTGTLDMALAASGSDHATVQHKHRLLSDNGPSYIAGELAEYIDAQKLDHIRGAPMHPQTQGKNRTLAPEAQEPHLSGKLLPARRP